MRLEEANVLHRRLEFVVRDAKGQLLFVNLGDWFVDGEQWHGRADVECAVRVDPGPCLIDFGDVAPASKARVTITHPDNLDSPVQTIHFVGSGDVPLRLRMPDA